MNINEEMRICDHQSMAGIAGNEIGIIFDTWIKEFGAQSVYLVCSYAYNLGKIHGKREERARRKRK